LSQNPAWPADEGVTEQGQDVGLDNGGAMARSEDVVRSARSSNDRIKRELGWSPRFPSARVGVPAAIAALRG
jgi:hypothetical protein